MPCSIYIDVCDCADKPYPEETLMWSLVFPHQSVDRVGRWVYEYCK
jgi:hypothetical protein